MGAYAENQLMEDLYDLIKVNALGKQDDEYSRLSRKHAQEASKNLHEFLKNKNIEWDGDNNTIYIGKHVRIVLEVL